MPPPKKGGGGGGRGRPAVGVATPSRRGQGVCVERVHQAGPRAHGRAAVHAQASQARRPQATLQDVQALPGLGEDEGFMPAPRPGGHDLHRDGHFPGPGRVAVARGVAPGAALQQVRVVAQLAQGVDAGQGVAAVSQDVGDL